MLEYFDKYNKKYCDNKVTVASYYYYIFNNIEGIRIGQGADGLFIKLESLNKFEDYYNIIKDYDYVNYHDDYYISYYFYLKQIRLEFIHPPFNSYIYTPQISSTIDTLLLISGKNNRLNLNHKVNEILCKLNNEGKFDEVKNN